MRVPAPLASLWRRIARHGLDLLGAAVAVVYALPSLYYPFGRDHGVHWYLGRRLLEGEMPYVSGISTKPPAVFFVHALSIALFGDRQSSVRVVDLLFVLLAGLLIATFRPRRRLLEGTVEHVHPMRPGEIGAACLAVAAFHYTFFDFSDVGHPALWQGVAFLASAWVIARAPDGVVSMREAFLCGVFACVAVMFKHVAALGGVLCGVAVVAMALRRGAPLEALKGAGAYTGGVALILVLTLAPFWITGSWDAFWELMVDHILHYASESAGTMRGPPPWLTYDHGLFAVIGALTSLSVGLGISAVTRRRAERWVGIWILLTSVVVFVSVAIQKRAFVTHIFTYYFVVLTPFLGLCLVWGLRQRFGRHGWAQLAVVALLTAAAFAYEPKWTHRGSWSYQEEWRSYWEHSRGRRTRAERLAPYQNSPLDAYLRQERVGAYIRSRAREGDTLCVEGFVPVIYQLTGLRCPGRAFLDGWNNDFPPWREEFRAMMRRSLPRFYLTFSDRPTSIRQMESFGYERHDLDDGQRPYYVVFELPRDRQH